MADQQTPKKKWTKPVIGRPTGAEADRLRALIMERNGLSPESIGVRRSDKAA